MPLTRLIRCLGLLGAAMETAGAQTFTVLHSFSFTNYSGGAAPVGNLAMGANGVLYGATQLGGAYSSCLGGEDSGCGTIYALTPPSSPGGAWAEQVLWSFGGTSTDAYLPSGVTTARDGILYGLASGGPYDYGTVFSLTPPESPGAAWTEKVIYQFAGPPDGEQPPPPSSNLAIGGGGVMYGTTYFGGTSTKCYTGGCGTVFALAPPSPPGGNWTETVLWSFGGEREGSHPEQAPVIGADGVLYGTTPMGGSEGYGVVFSLSPPGRAWTEKVLYNFPASAEQRPASLTLGADGVLYGTTNSELNGKHGGTAFSLTPPTSSGGAWTVATLFTFPLRFDQARSSDLPNGPLVLDKDTGYLPGATGFYYGEGTTEPPFAAARAMYARGAETPAAAPFTR